MLFVDLLYLNYCQVHNKSSFIYVDLSINVKSMFGLHNRFKNLETSRWCQKLTCSFSKCIQRFDVLNLLIG